jgi:hypothetical protein
MNDFGESKVGVEAEIHLRFTLTHRWWFGISAGYEETKSISAEAPTVVDSYRKQHSFPMAVEVWHEFGTSGSLRPFAAIGIGLLSFDLRNNAQSLQRGKSINVPFRVGLISPGSSLLVEIGGRLIDDWSDLSYRHGLDVVYFLRFGIQGPIPF